MVRLEGTIKRFIGQSTDLKPATTDEDKIPAGSSFLETDTGKIARFDGNVWQIADDGSEVRELLAALLTETQRIGQLLSLASGVEMSTHEGVMST